MLTLSLPANEDSGVRLIERLRGMQRSYWRSSGDVDTVVITFKADPPIRVELDAGEIDDALAELGEMRALMQPEHPAEVPEVVVTVFNPTCACDSEPVLAHSVLHIRDPRFGWLHYVIPRDVGDELAAALVAYRTGQAKGH
jgi:hypothetical protein